jgi:hypothetical protein
MGIDWVTRLRMRAALAVLDRENARELVKRQIADVELFWPGERGLRMSDHLAALHWLLASLEDAELEP